MSTSQLTIKQAALALGISTRTLRRRITEGEVSSAKVLRGKLEVVMLDAAEVARFAEATGLVFSVNGARQGTPRRQPPADTGADERQPAQDLRAAYEAQQVTIAVLQAQLRYLQEQNAELLVRALPPAPEPRLSWWRRLTGRGE